MGEVASAGRNTMAEEPVDRLFESGLVRRRSPPYSGTVENGGRVGRDRATISQGEHRRVGGAVSDSQGDGVGRPGGSGNGECRHQLFKTGPLVHRVGDKVGLALARNDPKAGDTLQHGGDGLRG